jgi:sugar lactone lactonase YvrE
MPMPTAATLAMLFSALAGAMAWCPAQSQELVQIRGVQAPEDLELLPSGRRILISETAVGNRPGRFAYLDLATNRVTEIVRERSAFLDWGDPACRQRPSEQLSPHGIHLSRRPDGRLLLLAINHGEQESVHAYEVADTDGGVRLLWRGCVDTTFNFNDLTATPDGFIATHQFDKGLGTGPRSEKYLFGGGNTGFAVRWSQASGFMKIAGTEAAFPNGITVSADGRTAFMVATTGREVRKIDLARNVQVARAPLPVAADNLSWTPAGRLLVTGALNLHRLVDCSDHGHSCPVAFAVVRIDPETLESRIVFRNDGRLLLGASVALAAQGNLYIGSFAGDHILQAPIPPTLAASE